MDPDLYTCILGCPQWETYRIRRATQHGVGTKMKHQRNWTSSVNVYNTRAGDPVQDFPTKVFLSAKSVKTSVILSAFLKCI